MLKHHNQLIELMEEKLHLGLGFQRVRVYDGGAKAMTGEAGSQHHHKHQAERGGVREGGRGQRERGERRRGERRERERG